MKQLEIKNRNWVPGQEMRALGKEIKYLIIDGEAWLSLSDVCKTVNYKIPGGQFSRKIREQVPTGIKFLSGTKAKKVSRISVVNAQTLKYLSYHASKHGIEINSNLIQTIRQNLDALNIGLGQIKKIKEEKQSNEVWNSPGIVADKKEKKYLYAVAPAEFYNGNSKQVNFNEEAKKILTDQLARLAAGDIKTIDPKKIFQAYKILNGEV